MVSTDDIVDIISRFVLKTTLSGEKAKTRFGFFTQPDKPYNLGFTTLSGGRKFFSEYDLRQCLKRGERVIRLPKGTIISPLAQEIIDEKGIKIEII